MKRILFVALVAAGTIFTSCKKDSPATCTLSSSSIIGSYTMIAATSQLSTSSPVVDNFSASPADVKDNILTFKSDGTYVETDGGIVSTGGYSFASGTWSLSGTTLTTTDWGISTISNFNCSTFEMKTGLNPTTGQNIKMTLKRQ